MTTQSAPKNWREARRLRAFELKQAGWTQPEIAEALGVSRGAVRQWMKAAEEGGGDALRSRPRPGRPGRLSSENRNRLPALLARGAETYGFRGEVWTGRRVAQLIQDEFGVTDSQSPTARVLKAVGWTPRKPVERASQRDEADVERWREKVWPALKKRRGGKETRWFS